MALKIILPDDLDNKGTTYLFAALQALGAVSTSGREWHFKKGVISPEDFGKRLKEKLPQSPGLADRVKIEVLRGEN